MGLPVMPLRERVVEIEAALGTRPTERYRYGSGFRLGGRLVLTAASRGRDTCGRDYGAGPGQGAPSGAGWLTDWPVIRTRWIWRYSNCAMSSLSCRPRRWQW